jgi:hypothetical protein
MNNAPIFATPTAEGVAMLPASDRREIVAHAIALAVGLDVDRPNPLAGDLMIPKMGGDLLVSGRLRPRDVATALGLDSVRGLFTSNDLLESVRTALLLVRPYPDDVEHRAICGKIDASDFRPIDAPRVDGGYSFELGESQEIPPINVRVGGEQITLKAFGAVAHITREAIVNCDFGLMAATQRELVSAAYRRERSAVVQLLNSNPVLADGVAMFDAARGNLSASAVGMNADGLGSLHGLLRSLPGSAGVPLNLRGRVLTVPATRAVAARQAVRESGLDWTVFDDAELSGAKLLPSPEIAPAVGLALISDRPEIVLRRDINDRWGVRCLAWHGTAALSHRAVSAAIAAVE